MSPKDHADARPDERHAAEDKRQPIWLAPLLANARAQKGWSIAQVIARSGLEPAEKFERQLERLESAEDRLPTDSILEALADVLGIRQRDAYMTYAQECSFYDALDTTPQMLARLMPAIYNQVRYPEGFKTEHILLFAHEFSAQHHLRVCVTLPMGRSVYIEPHGDRSESQRAPSMRIRLGRSVYIEPHGDRSESQRAPSMRIR